MKLFVISTLAALVLSSLMPSAQASCRDNAGPRGSYETCKGGP